MFPAEGLQDGVHCFQDSCAELWAAQFIIGVAKLGVPCRGITGMLMGIVCVAFKILVQEACMGYLFYLLEGWIARLGDPCRGVQSHCFQGFCAGAMHGLHIFIM